MSVKYIYWNKEKLNLPEKGRKSGPLFFLINIMLVCMMAACTDKDLLNSEPEQSYIDEATEMTLSFTVHLDKTPATKALSYIEGDIDNYVDTTNMFQLLFLDSQGDFLFQPPVRYIQESPDHDGQWYVTIPLNNNIKDDSGKSILSLVKTQLESESFKIAVLANWKTKEGSSPYKVNWGWSQSALNKGVSKPANINDLHHLEPDSYYSNDSRKAAYQFIMDGDRMGLNSEWVKYRNVKGKESMRENEYAWHIDGVTPDNSISEDAYAWIRKYWDPEIDKEFLDKESTAHAIYRQYSQLWQLWNLGGGFGDNEITYKKLGIVEDFAEKWKSRNADNNSGNFASEDWCLYKNHWLKNGQICDGLTAVTAFTGVESGENDSRLRSFNGSDSETKPGYYGLIIPKMDPQAIENSTSGEPKIKLDSRYAHEYIKFKAPGTGKLRLFYSSLEDNNSASIVVQRGTNWLATFSTNSSRVVEIGSKNNESVKPYTSSGFKVQLTADPEEIIIYCLEGAAVVYAIEFVCDEYLSGTDREGIIPSRNYPIPMYGIQNFPRIDSWGSQKLLNLSQTGIYVSLIRSLAKVELYLPAGKEISHVYLRSMNRKSRCEPMDVINPTSDHWKTHAEGENNCEWFRIQAKGASYGSGTYKDGNEWVYGSWSAWWEGVSEQINPPHIFNPDVERSDFCHFIKDYGYEDGLYHRYILYVPEKAISDPNNANDLSSTAKVCHIEYRHSDMSEYLDDNECYRIYFTDYSTNSDIKSTLYNEFETKFEKNKSSLDKLWPIMRNHIYRFYVGQGHTPQEIRVKVTDWDDSEAPKREEW